MKARLKNALALLECHDVETLAVQFLKYSFFRSSLSGLIISLMNKAENKLEKLEYRLNTSSAKPFFRYRYYRCRSPFNSTAI